MSLQPCDVRPVQPLRGERFRSLAGVILFQPTADGRPRRTPGLRVGLECPIPERSTHQRCYEDLSTDPGALCHVDRARLVVIRVGCRRPVNLGLEHPPPVTLALLANGQVRPKPSSRHHATKCLGKEGVASFRPSRSLALQLAFEGGQRAFPALARLRWHVARRNHPREPPVLVGVPPAKDFALGQPELIGAHLCVAVDGALEVPANSQWPNDLRPGHR